MNQKQRIYNHDELEAEIEQSRQPVNFKQSKHSLDSDEEDEKEKAKKYNILDPNELEGQEDRTIDFDGEIRITPFNMKAELEEGYFDKEGTYIFQKEEDVVKDQWLDDIDWIKVKAREENKRSLEENEDESDEETPPIDVVGHYSQMILLMKPQETVQKAICRLGGSTASRSASSKWKKKKDSSADETASKNEEDVEKLQTLTSLANNLIQSGDMDVYQQTYEKMTFYVNSKQKSNKDQNGSGSKDAELDMFGDEFEEAVDENKSSLPGHRTPSPSADAVDANSEVMWEFKWENVDDSKIYGPFPTSQMQQWVEEKYFEDGVFVRQVDKPDADFYSSKRMDFELYM